MVGTGLWNKGLVKNYGNTKGDRGRIHLTNEDFADQVIEYIKPSLRRHEGCDLIDIYPGAGVWSKKLHDAIRPRSHILMEPDAKLYEPFLKPLLEKPGVKVVPKSGIVWTDLNEVLTPEFLPHQVEIPRTFGPDAEPPPRNDTLLVSINLALYPRKKFANFDSITSMVLFQLISAVRTSSIFQKYGVVRMLVWSAPEDQLRLLPQMIHRRRRAAIDTELNTEWVRKVVAPEREEDGMKLTWTRDPLMDIEIGRRVLAKMADQGIVTPPGRESRLMRELQAMDPNATPFIRPDVLREIQELEAQQPTQREIGGERTRLQTLTYYASWLTTRNDLKTELVREMDAISNLYAAGKQDEAQRMDAEWNARINKLNERLIRFCLLKRDQAHIFHQDPPVLLWDQRTYEPLLSKPDDFFPNVPICLLDIQPKAPHWRLRDMGKGSSRSGDIFELVLRNLMNSWAVPVRGPLKSIWPGAAEGILPYCPSLYDPARGGSRVSGHGEVSVRALNEGQLMEILDAWMKWPFAPTFPELVARLQDENLDGDESPGERGSERRPQHRAAGW